MKLEAKTLLCHREFETLLLDENEMK